MPSPGRTQLRARPVVSVRVTVIPSASDRHRVVGDEHRQAGVAFVLLGGHDPGGQLDPAQRVPGQHAFADGFVQGAGDDAADGAAVVVVVAAEGLVQQDLDLGVHPRHLHQGPVPQQRRHGGVGEVAAVGGPARRAGPGHPLDVQVGQRQELGDPGPGVGEHRPLDPLAGRQGELERLRLIQRAERLLPLPGVHAVADRPLVRAVAHLPGFTRVLARPGRAAPVTAGLVPGAVTLL